MRFGAPILFSAYLIANSIDPDSISDKLEIAICFFIIYFILLDILNEAKNKDI